VSSAWFQLPAHNAAPPSLHGSGRAVPPLLAPGNAADLAKVIDLEMLVIASGQERTEVEYRQLFATGGWRLIRVLPTRSPAHIVEAEPA
jgi:hypothetical protein